MTYETFETEQPRKVSALSGCLIGCAVVCGVMVLLFIGVIWWVSQNWRGWAGSVAAQVIDAGIDQSQLPPEEKAELKEQVKRLTDGFADGSISGPQLERVATGFGESPLMRTFMVWAAEAKYVAGSGLTDEEKAAARTTLQRFANGMMNEQIDEQARDELLAHVADRGPDGEWQLREQLTDDELRTFLDAAKQKADEVGVPEEIDPVDPSDELKRIIDEALAEPAA